MSRVAQESLRREGIVSASLDFTVQADPRRLHPHYHDFFQLALVRGTGMVMHDFRDYAVQGETLLFLSPGQVHTIQADGDLTGVVLSFSQSFYDHTSAPPSELLDLPFFFPVKASTAPLLPIPPGDAFRIVETVGEIHAEFTAARPLAGAILRAWLHILFARIRRLYQQVQPVEEPTASARLARAFQLAVEHHFRHEVSLETYARDLGVTANHLNDVVRKETKHSAGSLIRERRLLDAKRLLAHSTQSVSEIGYEVGFHDPSYFGRFFRKLAGCSPAVFRAQIREKYHSNDT